MTAASGRAPLRKTVIASSNLRRWPTATTPISRKSSLVSLAAPSSRSRFRRRPARIVRGQAREAIRRSRLILWCRYHRWGVAALSGLGPSDPSLKSGHSSKEAAMWTPVSRCQHSRKHLRYGSYWADGEWAIIGPLLPARRRTGRPGRWPMRELVNAFFYVLRSGCPWRMVPTNFAPHSTVYRWFLPLRDERVFETINYHLLIRDRERVGREP